MHDNNRTFKNGTELYDEVLKNTRALIKDLPDRIIVRSIFDLNQDEISILDIADEMFNNGFNIISIEFPWMEKESSLALNDEKLIKVKNMINRFSEEYINRIKRKDYSLIGVHEFNKIIFKLLNKEISLDINIFRYKFLWSS